MQQRLIPVFVLYSVQYSYVRKASLDNSHSVDAGGKIFQMVRKMVKNGKVVL